MKPSVTPLRYPGNKTWLLGYVEKFLESNKITPGRIVEPYAGTASISVGLLRDGIVEEAFICESDPLIVSFWQAIKFHMDELIESVRRVEVTLDTWNSFRKYLPRDATKKFSQVELALAFLFYNRTNYSGIVKAGPMGGKGQKSLYKLDCRFNKEWIIKKIRKLEDISDKITVTQADGLKFMEKMVAKYSPEDTFFYMDPPYYKAGKVLYRDYFNDKDHEDLAQFLKNLEHPWLLSYDDSEFIRTLFKSSEGMPIYTDYQANYLKRKEKEFLFSNKVIPPGSSNVNFKQHYDVKLKFTHSFGRGLYD